MNNKTMKEVLINDSIKITNRKVILINQDKETNKIKNFVYLDIITEGLDLLEETYGDYNVEMFNCNNAHYNDLDFNKSVVKEIKRMQGVYSKSLCEETNLTRAQLKRLFNRKVNVYITAEEAVEYGFADKIL